MVSLDVSLIIQIVNFILLIWLLNILLYKPIRRIVLERKNKFTGIERAINTLNGSARDAGDAYALGVKGARAKGLKEKDAFLSVAAEEEKEIIDKINKTAQENLAEVRKRIAKDAESVRVSLQKELTTFTDAIGKKILGRAV
ncbi:MAG: ATPase [Deltaproteobacteria bacterium]|nr:ATPase [Deltaproteobacteria bacterium]